MKNNQVLNLILVVLMTLLAASAGATKVRQVTFAAGMGQADNETHGVKLTIGQPFTGKTINLASDHQVVFGFWGIQSRTYSLSPVGSETPTFQTQLFNNFPNPFNPSTRVQFSLNKESFVRIEIYDLKGRRVDTLFEGVKPSGNHTITYQPVNLASGSYVILMRADSFRATQRMMLIK